MNDILPDYSMPWITVQINGLSYIYTIEKEDGSDSVVFVRNKDTNGGYIFEERDDWSGKSGGTIRKYFRFGYSDASRWGDGSIDVEGDGAISGAVVVYNYKMDVDDTLMKCTLTPLADPECPGFSDALANFLKNLEGELSIDDPFYDEWVQAQLDKEVELKEEEAKEEKDEEESDLEKDLGGENSIDAMVDSGKQAEMLAALSAVPKIESYYTVEIQGGVYEETLVLEDATLPDNRRALRNLASDETHRSMVRSQYDR